MCHSAFSALRARSGVTVEQQLLPRQPPPAVSLLYPAPQVRFFAEQDFLNGFFKARPLPLEKDAMLCMLHMPRMLYMPCAARLCTITRSSVPAGCAAPPHPAPHPPQGKWRHLPYSYNGQKRIKVHHPDLVSLAWLRGLTACYRDQLQSGRLQWARAYCVHASTRLRCRQLPGVLMA